MTVSPDARRPLSVLLTGASGFVGRFLGAELRRRGHRLVAIVRPGSAGGDADAVHYLDLALPVDPGAIPPVDVVVHLAQSPFHRNFPEKAADIFQVNTAATFALAEGARRVGARGFVLASTGGVSAANGLLADPDAQPPGSFYVASKIAAEALLAPYSSHMATCALRLFTPYGPGQSNRIIPALIERVRSGAAITLDGEGDGLRFSAVYILDLARLMAGVIEQGWKGTFDVAAPGATSIREVGLCAAKLLGRTGRFERSGLPEPRPLLADLGRLSAVYDLRELRPIEEGLADMLAAA